MTDIDTTATIREALHTSIIDYIADTPSVEMFVAAADYHDETAHLVRTYLRLTDTELVATYLRDHNEVDEQHRVARFHDAVALHADYLDNVNVMSSLVNIAEEYLAH